MSVYQSLQEINHQAISVLCREIGIANTLRFIKQFSTGSGDFTTERQKFMESQSLDSILNEIKQMRADKAK